MTANRDRARRRGSAPPKVASDVAEALGLDDVARAAVDAILAAPEAFCATSDLERAGTSPETLRTLVAAGLAIVWADDSAGRPVKGGPYVTLTPFAAWALNVAVIERGPDEILVWGTPSDIVPFVRVAREKGHRPMKFPELVVDMAPGPPDIVIDEYTGEPLRLFGRDVMVDNRLRRDAARRIAKRTGKVKAKKAAKTAGRTG